MRRRQVLIVGRFSIIFFATTITLILHRAAQGISAFLLRSLSGNSAAVAVTARLFANTLPSSGARRRAFMRHIFSAFRVPSTREHGFLLSHY